MACTSVLNAADVTFPTTIPQGTGTCTAGAPSKLSYTAGVICTGKAGCVGTLTVTLSWTNADGNACTESDTHPADGVAHDW